MSKLLSRKFLLAVAVLAAATGLLIAGKIDAAGYERIVIWVTGLYLGANVSEAAVEKAKKAAAAKKGE